MPTSPPGPVSTGEPAYRWVIVIVTAIIMAGSLGLIMNGISVFLVPLEQEFGWGRGPASFISFAGLAGIAVGGTLDMSDDEYEPGWTRALDVLLTSHQRIIRAALPQMRRAGDGRIINIASTEGLGATANTGPYTAAKHGVVGLTRSMALDLGREGITANCICPGPILTGLTEGIPKPNREKFARRRVPVRRYAIPEEVAHMTLSLALPAASFLNGVAIPVDGGLSIQNT